MSLPLVVNLSLENRQGIVNHTRNMSIEGSPEDQFMEAVADILEMEAPLTPFLEFVESTRESDFANHTGFFLLSAYATHLGEPELALSLLKDNPVEISGNLGWVWFDFYSEVRQLPAFKDFMQEVGLVDYWRTSGEWNKFCQPIPETDDFECH